MLANAATHAPQQLANGIASLQLSGEVPIDGLPTPARWFDHGEIRFSKVQRDVLPPHDFCNLKVLEQDLLASVAALHGHPKPSQGTDPKATWLVKCRAQAPDQLAA
jgi:hypothetical protein